MSPDLRKADESVQETRYAYNHLKGWVVLLIAAVAGFAGSELESVGDWAMVAFGAFLALLALWRIFYRMELVLDFAQRRYRYREGHLGSMEDGEGSFEEIREVILKHEHARGDREEWEVELVIDGWSSAVEVAESVEEEVAREEAERLADRIDVSLRETSDA